ncbi:MAG: glycosyltransferase [Acidobacteriota bacterium]
MSVNRIAATRVPDNLPDDSADHHARPLLLARPPGQARPGILHVVLSLQPGGTEHLVIEMCKRMTAFAPTVCCLDDEGEWAAGLKARGIEVVALHRGAGFRPDLGRRIARLALDRGAGLLHCHQYSPFVYGRIATYWSPRLQLVYTEHGRLSDAPPTWKRQLANRILSIGDGSIVAVSHELRRYMIDSRFPDHRVEVIHNGIDIGTLPSLEERWHARRALGLEDDALVVATVARLDPVKDLGTLLEAFVLLHRQVPHARLLIVGDGPEYGDLMERASRADLAGLVHMTGYRADVRALLPAADVYASSSISEGVSLTILEAMGAGVAVVATAVGGSPEVLPDDSVGVLVPSRDPVRLAAAIIALAGDRPRLAAVARGGRQRLESAFTIDRMVGDYERIYRRRLAIT